MHVPQDLMWRGILKTFWFLGWTKQGPKLQALLLAGHEAQSAMLQHVSHTVGLPCGEWSIDDRPFHGGRVQHQDPLYEIMESFFLRVGSPVREPPRALFSFEKWKIFGTVAISFVCDKYYPIMD